jgi:CheY-like chemotaxis protein
MVARGRVLIADDEPDILDVLQEMVTAFGYEVTAAAESAAVVEVAAAFRPDVILLDHAMPGLSGKPVSIRVLKRTLDEAIERRSGG